MNIAARRQVLSVALRRQRSHVRIVSGAPIDTTRNRTADTAIVDCGMPPLGLSVLTGGIMSVHRQSQTATGSAEAMENQYAKTSLPEWQRQMFERQGQKGLKNHVLTSTPARGIVKFSAKREMAVPVHHRPYGDQ